MRIFVNSDEGGKPFELFTHEDNGLDEPGWYYMLMRPKTDRNGNSWFEDDKIHYIPLEDAPTGPFFSLTAAFNRAIGANYGDQPIFLDNDNTDTELDDAMQRVAKEAAERIIG